MSLYLCLDSQQRAQHWGKNKNSPYHPRELNITSLDKHRQYLFHAEELRTVVAGTRLERGGACLLPGLTGLRTEAVVEVLGLPASCHRLLWALQGGRCQPVHGQLRPGSPTKAHVLLRCSRPELSPLIWLLHCVSGVLKGQKIPG